MASAAPEVKTHFELASFVDETIMSSIKGSCPKTPVFLIPDMSTFFEQKI